MASNAKILFVLRQIQRPGLGEAAANHPAELRARPHLDSGLSPHQQAFGCEINLPADFASKEAEELDGVDFYEQLKQVRDGYTYPPAVHHTRDDGEASEALQNATFVLVRQDGHKPPLAAAYRGPL